MRLLWFTLVSLLFLVALAGPGIAGPEDDPIVVIEIADPLDQVAIDYVISALRAEDAYLHILKINSPGVSSGDIDLVLDAIEGATVPVVSWIGPVGAEAYGGAALLTNRSDIRSAAPGATVGYLNPAVQRGDEGLRLWEGIDPGSLSALSDSAVVVSVEAPTIAGFVDRVDAALGQLILSLDETIVTRGDQTWELDTARTETVDGQDFVVATRSVRFIKPGFIDRFVRLAARPETAFLFLLVGLAFATFEFYAAGRGLMAGVAAVSLLLAGYGMATLPMWWPAVGITLVGAAVIVWGFSRNRVDWRAFVGTLLLLVGGFTFTTSRPAYPPAAWMVILAVAISVVFIWYSLTTVVRGRFATPTIGREELLGRRCLAVTDLDPEGVVLIDDARWAATADRGIVIGSGAVVQIVGLTGLVVEVDPVVAGREEIS